jgi:hypothetical protein
MKLLNNLSQVKLSATILLTILTVSCSYAQMDTVFVNNQKIACSVKEITPEAIKYSFPGEDVVNSVYKNTVQKIVFKSGRVQIFAESTSFKVITGVMDYDKVTVTSVESEIRGLFKLSDVSSKAKGTTIYSNQERVKDRAYRKIKIQAAMFGANIIYLTNQRTEGNKYGSYYSSGSTSETNLTGVAYSNTLPDFDKFKQLIGSKNKFIAILRYELGASDSDVSQDQVSKSFEIHNISNDNGIITIDANLQGESDVNNFQLVGFTDQTFNIAYKYKGTAYNYTITL